MFKGTFSVTFLLVLLLVSSVAAQRPTDLSQVERRERRAEYNRKIDDPANNPYQRGENPSDRELPGQKPTNLVLRLQPPKRIFLEIEINEVLDGDTVAIKNAQNQRVVIRLLGIDAPELEQEFGTEAKKNLEEKLAARKVRLEFEPHGVPDEQGRILAKILVDDLDISAEQVRAGLAWYYEEHKDQLGLLEISQFKELQSGARKEKLQL